MSASGSISESISGSISNTLQTVNLGEKSVSGIDYKPNRFNYSYKGQYNKQITKFDKYIIDIELHKLDLVCKDFMNGMCERQTCKYIHDSQLCKRYWRNRNCKYGESCRKKHTVSDLLYENYKNNEKEKLNNETNQQYVKNKEFQYKKFDFKILNDIVNVRNELSEKQIRQIQDILNDSLKKNQTYKNISVESGRFESQSQSQYSPRIKNTETFEPMQKPVDMRVVYDLGCYQDKLSKTLKTRDVLLVPNLFRDFEENEIYNRLIDEIKNCGIPEEKVIIPWHGNNVIKGTHMIASDWEKWKRSSPTFNIVINRIREFFDMNIKATRLNWYQNTEQWKAFHFDAAKINPEKAKIQNFTVSVSFGRTRDCAFERDDNLKNVISFPIGDGEMYCFTKETNEMWRHGVLQELPIVEDGRISIVAWGWIDDVIDVNEKELSKN